MRHALKNKGAKKKRFQVTRFPASPTAGMPGSERRTRKRRASASPLPVRRFSSFRINASWLAAAFLASPDRSRILVTAFPSPATAAPFDASIPGSKVLACYFVSRPVRFPARSAFRSATGPGSPRCRPPHRFGPLRLHALARPAAPPASTPLRDFYLPRDQSVQQNLPPADSPSESARSPLAPRSPVLLLDSAADHRPRSATFPEAGCSSNLLEPHSICA